MIKTLLHFLDHSIRVEELHVLINLLRGFGRMLDVVRVRELYVRIVLDVAYPSRYQLVTYAFATLAFVCDLVGISSVLVSEILIELRLIVVRTNHTPPVVDASKAVELL